MSEIQSFKRFPAVRCWIKHLLEGRYLSDDKTLFTIFGKVKRVRIVATIIEKREILNTQLNNGDTLIEDDDNTNLRIEFDLDDGTGLIRAILWRVNPELYYDFKEGNIVDVVGIVRQWKEFTSISPEIIKEIKDPNNILLRNAEIIKKIKLGEVQEIPEVSDENFEIAEISSEIDINDLFEGEQNSEVDDLKEKIYSIIEKRSLDGNGINFEELKKILHISEDELRNLIRDLEMESRIYQAEENNYQSY